MTQPDRDTVESVEKLLTEARKVAGWLAALDARRVDTAPAVYERVHADYQAKLEKVQGKLTAAADSVQALAADVAMRLTDKEQALAAKREERAEAELRAAVGEYSEREWEKRRTRLDDDIAAAAAERDALHSELTRLRDVLDEATGRTATPAVGVDAQPGAWAPAADADPEPVGFQEPAPASVTDEEPAIPIFEQAASVPPAPAAVAAPAAPGAPGFDELAFLKTVVGRPTPVSSPALRQAADRATTSASAAPAALSEDAAGVAPSDYVPPEPPLEYPDPMPEPRVSQEMTPPRESFFGRPTPRSSEAVKSLKCAECGTLNFPTEWYCERCGGELAAM